MIEMSLVFNDVQEKLEELSKKYGIAFRDFMYDEMRLSMNNAIKYTQPSEAKQVMGGAKGVKAGKQRIEKDIKKIFRAYNDYDSYDRFWKDKKTGDYGIKIKGAGVYFVEAQNFGRGRGSYNLAKMEKTHNQFRDKRGRVVDTKGLSYEKHGAKYSSLPHVKRADRNKFIKFKQERVGNMKAGWVPALTRFSRLVNKQPSPPAYVAKQESKTGVSGGTINKQGNGSVWGQNNVAYFGPKRKAEIEGLIHSIAQKRLQEPKGLKQRINRLTAEFNRSQ